MVREQWEYRVTMLGEEALENQAKLNRCGDEGWELVAVASSAESRVMMAYLRRRRESSQPRQQ